ncbi:MAG: hypothetical protein P1V18_02105 [Candidatus Gracilibacteria bacterium]|nr:hypothetical protein [Candidatus Gracilibacteria bacterium]
MKINSQHHVIILSVGIAVLLVWFGRLSVQFELHSQLPPLQMIEEVNQKIPQVVIQDIQEGRVIGSVNNSEIRIVSGEQVAVPEDDLSFLLNIEHLGYIGPKRQIITKEVPEWARFVASKNGKYFYEIDEKSLKKLSVANQIYFATEEDAVAAGKVGRER